MLPPLASMLVRSTSPGSAAETDWSKVATALGKSGTEMPGGVYRVGMPRTDLHVTLDGVELKADVRAGLLARVPATMATRPW